MQASGRPPALGFIFFLIPYYDTHDTGELYMIFFGYIGALHASACLFSEVRVYVCVYSSDGWRDESDIWQFQGGRGQSHRRPAISITVQVGEEGWVGLEQTLTGPPPPVTAVMRVRVDDHRSHVSKAVDRRGR